MAAFNALPADWLAKRRAAEFARDCQPEEIAYREKHIAWMKACAASADTGPRYAIGAEMDGRSFTAGEIEAAEAYLARCKAHVAEMDALVAAVERCAA